LHQTGIQPCLGCRFALLRPKRDNSFMCPAGQFSEQHELKIWAGAQCLRKSALLLAGLCFFSYAVVAQTADSSPSDSNRSWTAATDSKTGYGNPTRSFESHTQNGNRTVDVHSLQTRGPDGNFQPYQDVETETVRVSATTTKTTTRTFVRDSSGAKTLFQVTEEEKRTSPGGGSNVVRTTSNPDANGSLQVVQREVRETRKTSPDVEETKTTVSLPGINGGLAPATQIEERQKRSGNTVEIQKTTLLPDGAGSWQVGEVRQSTIKEDGKNSTTETRVSRPDADGNLEQVTRTVEKQSEDASGEKRNSEETYSVDVPGAGRDSSLHLVQRLTTAQRTNSNGQQTTTTTERTNPADPGAGLQVSIVSADTVRARSTGAQATRTIEMRDADGSLNVVSVDITKSDSAKAIQVQIAPAKPK
jgi:hypothetical protein